MLKEKRMKVRRRYYFLALLTLILTGLSLALCLFFATRGAFGGVFLRRDLAFLLREGDRVLLSPDRAEALSQGDRDLVLENREKAPLSYLLCQNGKALSEGVLSPGEEKRLSVSSDGSALSLLLAGKRSCAYLSDGASFAVISEKMPQGGDVIFLRESRIEGRLAAPFRLFGAFSFSELTLETDQKGSVVLSPQRAFSAPFYVSAPSCRLYFRAFSLPDEEAAFYLKAKGLNGKALSPFRIPVSSFEKLERLADPECLPVLTSASQLQVSASFALEKDLTLPLPAEITFSEPLTFHSHLLSFVSEKSGTCRMKTEALSAPSCQDLRFDAPFAHLVWEGTGNVPSAERLERYSRLASLNGKALSLGGAGTAKPTLVLPAAENSFLEEDAVFSLDGNQLSATLPFSVSPEVLSGAAFRLGAEGGTATLEGDLAQGKIVTKDASGQERRFALSLCRAPFQIPVVYLTTDEGAAIASKSQYVSGSFAMDGGESDYDSLSETHIRIRGRGNSSWKWEKKSYKIHFDEPTSLLGLSAAEEWALFANYADKSLIRNRLAQVMAATLSFDYCPTQVCVDLFLNGEYLGVYTLGEHLETGEGRVEIQRDPAATDCGYFMEAGGVVSGVDVKGMNYFHADLVKFVLIKDPDYGDMTSEQFQFIRNYMLKANDAVKAGKGYEDYLDLDTLVDWMIMTELSCNTDCSWRRSTYFSKNPGEKVKMGPMWDFDLAFGNFSKDNGDYDTWVSTEPDDDYVGTTWSTYLLADPAFQACFKARWQEVGKMLVDTALTEIEASWKLLAPSAEENFIRWDILGRKVAFERHDTTKYKTYESQIYYLENFIIQRAAWIDAQVESW